MYGCWGCLGSLGLSLSRMRSRRVPVLRVGVPGAQEVTTVRKRPQAFESVRACCALTEFAILVTVAIFGG